MVCAPDAHLSPPYSSFLIRFVFTYGLLVYRLLGQRAEGSFARSWGISYGIHLASEWREVLIEAAKAALLLAVLERLMLTPPVTWLEDAVRARVLPQQARTRMCAHDASDLRNAYASPRHPPSSD